MGESRMHLSKSPPLTGGQHGEESKGEEEDREEGEAESEALNRRLEVSGALSEASSTDPAQVERTVATRSQAM